MSDENTKWFAGWYATRLHCVSVANLGGTDNAGRAMCGAWCYEQPKTEYAARRLAKGVKRCKHCERLQGQLSGARQQVETGQPALRQCKCDLRTRLAGDGCETCNPQMAIDLLKEQVREQAEEIARLRAELSGARQRGETGQPVLSDAEREAINSAVYLCEATAGLADENANATAWATCAATLRGLLDRHGGGR